MYINYRDTQCANSILKIELFFFGMSAYVKNDIQMSRDFATQSYVKMSRYFETQIYVKYIVW